VRQLLAVVAPVLDGEERELEALHDSPPARPATVSACRDHRGMNGRRGKVLSPV
jgi:hypothetical protein